LAALVNSRVNPVSLLVTTNLAFGMTAPETSVTVPVMLPAAPCAKAGIAAKANRQTNVPITRNDFILLPSQTLDNLFNPYPATPSPGLPVLAKLVLQGLLRFLGEGVNQKSD